ncbi:MAG: Maf family protein [Acidobacteriota bacterium]|nr:Maf family protein [Blastocatellia bacterium]MDW8239699.1 Maf family protein [Acidobacteriota bacterium]
MIHCQAMYQGPIILASASPRREQILNIIQISPHVAPSGIEEPQCYGDSATNYVKMLARMKAEALTHRFDHGLIIGADTVVVIDGQIMGKPPSIEAARQMLTTLSGRWHEVLTGVCLIRRDTNQQLSGCQTTRVKFARLQPDELDWYLSSEEPLDKAGAYAIQGLGSLLIERIEGDYLNVVGLPLRLVYRLALRLGIDLKTYSTRRPTGRPR